MQKLRDIIKDEYKEKYSILLDLPIEDALRQKLTYMQTHSNQATTRPIQQESTSVVEQQQQYSDQTVTNTIQPTSIVEQKQISPARKGQILVDSIIKRLSTYNIRNVSNIAHNGDLRLNDIIMIECKHYSGVIGSDQVEKFYNDINTRNVYGALFISTAEIAKIGNFKFTHYHKGNDYIPIAFININVIGDLDSQDSVLMSLIDFMIILINNKNTYVIDEVDKSIIDGINSCIEDIGMLKNAVLQQQQVIAASYFDLISRVTRIYDKVSLAFKNLSEKHSKYDLHTQLTPESALITTMLEQVNKGNWKQDGNMISIGSKIIIEKLKTKIKLTIAKSHIASASMSIITYMDDVTIKKDKVTMVVTIANIEHIKLILKDIVC